MTKQRRRRVALLVAAALVAGSSAGWASSGSVSASAVGSIGHFIAPAASPPTISSDKADYSPGSLVTLTGAHWKHGETVHVTVNDTIGQTWHYSHTDTASSHGTFLDSFHLPSYFVSKYDVTATGSTGRVATTTFTDSNITFHGPSGTVVTYTLYSGTAATPNTTCSGSGTSTTVTIGASGKYNFALASYESIIVQGSGITTGSNTQDNETAYTNTCVSGGSGNITDFYFHPATPTGTVTVCKVGADAATLNTTFNFGLNPAGTQNGSPVSSVSATAVAAGATGGCAAPVTYPSGTSLTVTEQAAAGFTLTGIDITGATGTSNVGAGTETFTTGTGNITVTFTNAAVTTPTGTVTVCKVGADATTQGTSFTFGLNPAGTQNTTTVSSVSATAVAAGATGGCAAPVTYPSGTSLTVTEQAAAGFTLTGIDITGATGTSNVGAGTETFTTGTGNITVTFTNAAVVVPGSTATGTATSTPIVFPTATSTKVPPIIILTATPTNTAVPTATATRTPVPATATNTVVVSPPPPPPTSAATATTAPTVAPTNTEVPPVPTATKKPTKKATATPKPVAVATSKPVKHHKPTGPSVQPKSGFGGTAPGSPWARAHSHRGSVSGLPRTGGAQPGGSPLAPALPGLLGLLAIGLGVTLRRLALIRR